MIVQRSIALLGIALALAVVGCGADAGSPGATTTIEPVTSTTPDAPVTVVTTTPAIATTTTAPASVSTVAASTTTTTVVPEQAFPTPADGVVDRWLPVVVAEHPHDPTAFTQGLQFHDGELYETTGLYGASGVRRVDVATGEILAETRIADDQFGEGITAVDDHLVQLTWQAGLAYVWDPATLAGEPAFSYDGEGWGLCDLGDALAMSNGSEILTFRDRTTFEPMREVTVTLDGAPVRDLNELECVSGLVFANVWKTTDIVVIEPSTGVVTAVVDGSALDLWSSSNSQAVMNGIAYDAGSSTFQLTGKLWPAMYEVRFVDG